MNEHLYDMMMEATKDMPHCYYWPPEYVENLAKLIVKDCVNICNTTTDRGYLNGVVAGHKIKQHFGVEE